MMIIIFTLFYLLFMFLDFIPLKNEKQPKQFWLYSVTMAAAFIVSIALSMEMNIPSPAIYLERAVNLLLGK